MIRKEKNGLVWFEFELLQSCPKVRHAVFSRKGGSSTLSYESLNVSYTVGDEVKHVEENRKRLFSLFLGYTLIEPEQVHKDELGVVTDAKTDSLILGSDGLITKDSNVLLATRHADCQIALFFDTKKKILANVHAGWRGLVCNIYQKTVAKMIALYDTNPKDLRVCIGPSLGPNHAEFTEYKKELPEWFWKYKQQMHHFDLWRIAKEQLLCCGIPEHSIEIASLCTYTDEEHWFSYRRAKNSGRNMTVAVQLS